MDERWFLDVVSGRRAGARAAVARAAFAGVEPAYRLVVGRKNRRFDAGEGVIRLPRPVVSVGNLTTGGTGKSPFVAWVCERLLAGGGRPCVLMRGYKGGDTPGEASDEALEYAARFAGAVRVEAQPSRVAGAHAAVGADAGVTHFVLDDGFQHRRAARDLDVVLIDATNPFGYGRCLPRGLLREPLGSLARADAVVVTRCDLVDTATLQTIDEAVAACHGAPVAAHTTHAWTRSAGTMPLEALGGAGAVTAACGIGNPGAFRRQVELHAEVAAWEGRGDHHAWTREEAAALAGAGRPVVTTLKDWVKLRGLLDEWAVPVCVPVVGVGFVDGEDAVGAMIDAVGA